MTMTMIGDDPMDERRMSAGCRHPAPKPVDKLLCGSDVEVLAPELKCRAIICPLRGFNRRV
jgi:hypothetical protein